MNLVIASGKGGTGKTTVAVNMAHVVAGEGETVRLLDCDVEEPNDHLFVKPDFTVRDSVHVLKPEWDPRKCTGCGKCAEACNYNALAVVKEKLLFFGELCHACGLCSFVCPEHALTERPAVIGTVEAAPDHRPFFFAHGTLNVGEALAPSVVKEVKQNIDPDAVNIIDAAPGTACPVVEAVKGADAALLVTEPTPFGLNDLKLAAHLTLKMGVPTGILINRSDGEDGIIETFAASSGIPVLAKIPFRREYAERYSDGNILVDFFPELRMILKDAYKRLLSLVGTRPPPVPSEDEDVISVNAAETQPVDGTADNYREVAVISGKGGTGKTTLVGSFASLAGNQVLADNDVDAADLHLLLNPIPVEAHPFIGGKKATIDAGKCIGCGKCKKACHFDAVHLDGPPNDLIGKTYRVDDLSCEGCGYCPLVCPVHAIRSEPNETGTWYVSNTQVGPMAHARLGIAEENSGRLVTKVRERAQSLAIQYRKGQITGDGPPGTGCPVIASVSGADIVVIVTEPTVSGVHDMLRVLDLAAHFGIPTAIVINKADINRKKAEEIRNISRDRSAAMLGEIPFDPTVVHALAAGKAVVDYDGGPASEAIRSAHAALMDRLADVSHCAPKQVDPE